MVPTTLAGAPVRYYHKEAGLTENNSQDSYFDEIESFNLFDSAVGSIGQSLFFAEDDQLLLKPENIKII